MEQNDFMKLMSMFSSNKQSNKANAEKIVSSLDNNRKSELNSILNDKDKVNEILNSPAAKSIINKLNGK